MQARPGQQIAVKRPGEATAGPGGVIKKPPVPATATGKDALKLSVTSQSKTDDIGIQTLVGDYAEKGTNHNKKFYQKLQKIPGHEDIKVFLYFWDNRDGADFSGWWFGDQVGGTQVWARNPSASQTPPRTGWKVPWDSAMAKPGLLFVEPYKAPASPGTSPATTPRATGTPAGAPTPAGTVGAAAAGNSAVAARTKKATEKAEQAEKAVQATITKVKAALAASKPAEELKELQATMEKEKMALIEAQKSTTQEVNEFRKLGNAGKQGVTDLSKLLPKMRQTQASAVEQINKLKSHVGPNAQKDSKESEAKHTKELEEGLAVTKDLTSSAEESVMAIATMAEPIMSNPPPEGSEDLTKALDEVEATAKEAQDKITEARKAITAKLTEAREFQMEVRKKAMTEYSALQTKLSDAQRKIMPFRTFKRDFQAKVKAKQALTEFADKLNTAELEVEKAAMMGIAAESGQMSEEEIIACQKVAEPALAAVTAAIKEIELKHKSAQSAVREELNVLKDRGNEMRKKCEGVLNTMKSQKQGISAQQMAASVVEKVTAAEEALSACQDAEMPFLKGIEVLPAEESNKAISDCETAAAKADAALNQAKTLIRTKQSDARKFPKELQEKANKELTQLLARADACGKKIADFKKETNDRKLNAIMAEAVEAIKGAEMKVKAHAEVAKVFSEDLNSVTEEAIKDAMEKAPDLEKEAVAAMTEAKKEVATKQREAKGNTAMTAMQKLQGRLKVANDELMKNKKASTYGDKLIKGKEALAEEMGNVDKAEAEVAKVEKLAEPVAAVDNPTDEECAELGDAIVSAQNSIKATSKSVESHLGVGVPPLKAAFSKVADRNKKVQERLDKVLGAGKKGLRERALGEAYVREGKKKTAQVDSFVEKVNEAELPFLKGIEVLPLMEATSTIENSEKAAQELQQSISEARNFIAAKSVELRAFADKEKTKPLIEELTNLTGRINGAAQKHSAFKKDTDARKKNALLQEAAEKISQAEAEVEKVTESTAPLDDEASEALSTEEAAGICEKAGAQAKLAQEAVDASRAFLTTRQNENKGVAANAETVKNLQARLSAASSALTKAKKVVSNREHKFVAKKLMHEVEEMMSSLESEVKAAETASAPLLEKGGEEFLVAASLRTLAVALQSYGKEKGLDLEGLFQEAGGGKAIGEADFVTYLEKLPEVIGHPEVEFNEERRSALAKLVDADGDGQISLAEFKAIFQLKFVCVTGISMTDVLQVSVSKTTGKVETGEVMEALGPIAKDEATGMERVEVKVLSSGKQGFVTLKGNQGTTFLQESSPFSDFCTSLDKTLEERTAAVRKVITFIQQKGNELTAHNTGPLQEAKAEINKLRPKAQAHAAELQKLKTKVVAAKKDFAKAEAAEKTAHIEAKERKEAEAILKDCNGQVDAAEARSNQISSSAEALLASKGEDVLKFETPSSVLEEVEKMVPEAASVCNKVKTHLMEEIKKIKAAKGPLAEAKKELTKLTGKVESFVKKNAHTLQAVKAACKSISEAGAVKASAALRAEVHQKGMTFDAFFAELAEGGSIKHEALCKRLLSLDLGLSEEHAKLVCRKVEAGTIGKRAFQAFVQRYYSVTTAIAITTEFEISKAKTIRKAEVEEMFEVLEGPKSDEKLSLTRVRGRSLADGTEGWLSIKGNQGSLFLKEAEKPFYSISSRDEVRLDADFKVGDGEPVRMLKYGEVLEMLEGPRKETFPPGLRARGKATSDDAVGWFSIRDRQGTIFAEAEGKIYTCVSTVAMTDTFEIKDCQVVKKLAVGDLFAVEEGPLKQEDSGVTRVKGKTLSDEKVGWITITGNAGTTFASASKTHYAIVKEVKLQKTVAANSEVLKTLAPGEAVQVSETKEEAQQPSIRVRVRTTDGATGWITVLAGHVKRWTSVYKCLVATPMQSTCKAEGAETVREIAANEILQLLDGPVEEAGDLRMRAQAKTDSAEGWVTIRDSSGKRYMS